MVGAVVVVVVWMVVVVVDGDAALKATSCSTHALPFWVAVEA